MVGVGGSGWAVIGETAKWVPVNNARITDVSYDSSSVTVTAAGVHGETVSVGGAWWYEVGKVFGTGCG